MDKNSADPYFLFGAYALVVVVLAAIPATAQLALWVAAAILGLQLLQLVGKTA